jgi:aldose 1-epimerase
VQDATVTSASDRIVAIHSDAMSLGLVPDMGGSVAFARLGSVDILRPLSEEAFATHSILGVACFPMLPYANRIVGNQFEFDGILHRVNPNITNVRFNVHGSGWLSRWRVAAQLASTATLSLDHQDEHGPYSYHAEQTFKVFSSGFDIFMSIENRSGVRLPFGMGQHPWLMRDDDVTVAFKAKRFWLEAPDSVAGECISIPPELDFTTARRLPSTWRDNCYGGWHGAFELNYPTRGFTLRVEADPLFSHLMFYADPAKPYFCLEPQSNASCAFNQPQSSGRSLGVVVLAPNQSIRGNMHFHVASMSPSGRNR